MTIILLQTTPHYVGLAADTKPTGVPPGSVLFAYDTGAWFICYDGDNWATLTAPGAVSENAMSYDIAGVVQSSPRTTKRTATGPASYTQGTGIAVDLSAVFSTLISVRITRAYVTSTLADDTRVWRVHEASTDTFANRKFRVLAYVGNTPVGTNAAALVNLANGGAANVAVTAPNSNGAALAAGLTGGAGALTGLTGVQAAAFTGTAQTSFGAQVVGATDLSTITVEYEAVGII